MAYISTKKRNLPIYGIKSKTLRDYQTTEKDLYKQIVWMPLMIARIYEDDLYDEEDEEEDGEEGRSQEEQKGIAIESIENYKNLINIRLNNQSQKSGFNPIYSKDEIY